MHLSSSFRAVAKRYQLRNEAKDKARAAGVLSSFHFLFVLSLIRVSCLQAGLVRKCPRTRSSEFLSSLSLLAFLLSLSLPAPPFKNSSSWSSLSHPGNSAAKTFNPMRKHERAKRGEEKGKGDYDSLAFKAGTKEEAIAAAKEKKK